MGRKMIYTPKDVQEIFGLSKNVVYDIFRQETFPSIRIGKRHYITDEALSAWLKLYEGKRYSI